MIGRKTFEVLCSEIEMEITGVDPELFYKGAGVSVGNGGWRVTLYCADSELPDPSWPLLQLLRTRRDLLYRVVRASRFGEFLRAIHNLAEWLEPRGYVVVPEAKTRLGKIQLWLFNLASRTISFLHAR